MTHKVGNQVVVSAPRNDGALHVLQGEDVRVTSVRRSLESAKVLAPGMTRSVEVPLGYLWPAVDLTAFIAKAAAATAAATAEAVPLPKKNRYPDFVAYCKGLENGRAFTEMKCTPPQEMSEEALQALIDRICA